MKKFFDQFRGSLSGINLFCLGTYATFIVLFLLHEGSKLVSFDLKDVSTLYISEATTWGIDVSARVKWMYRFLAAAASLFLLVFFLLKRILKNPDELRKHEDLLLLSIPGIILCVMKIFGTDSTHVLSALFFLFCFKFILVVLHQNNVRVSTYLLNSGIFNLSMSFGFLLMFACVFLFGTSGLIYKNYSSILFIGTLVFIGYYFLMLSMRKVNARQATSFLLPLTAIPLAALLSVEVLFYKKQNSQDLTSYQTNFVWLFLVFAVIISILLFISRKKRVSSLKQYKRYIIPSLLVCSVLITSYEPVVDQTPDMFEPANILVSIQRVFEFDQIPALDFMSSHMLSEQWYGYVYSAIFGFTNDQSALCYSFLNSIIFIFILYHFLLGLFKRETYALAFIFFFPFVSDVFFTTVLVALLPLFQIRALFEQPSPRKILVFIITCFALVLWRIDTGVVAIFGSVLFLLLMYLVHPNKIPLKIIAKGLAFFGILAFGVLGIAAVLRGPSKILDSFQHFYHYAAGSQGHGHRTILHADVHQFYLYHILYPLLAVAMCLYILYLLKTAYRDAIFTKGYLLVAALFLFVLYIVHLQRGLVRHGFAEFNDEYIISVFHIASALFITFQFCKGFSIQKYGLFYGSTVLLFLVIKYFPFHISKIPIENGITERKFYNIEKPFDDPAIKGRVRVDTNFARINYAALKSFMDKYLTKDQSFFDFSNTSMLYYYCQRKMPSYFNQIPISAIDETLQLKAITQMDPEKIPLVVFSNYPQNFNDNFDEIPNVMRHPIIAEHIFKNYIPLGVMNHKTLWASAKLIHKINNFLPPDPSSYQAQQHNYKYAAEYIADHYAGENSNKLELVYKSPAGGTVSEGDMLTFELPADLKKPVHCYLALTFDKKDAETSPQPTTVQLLGDKLDVLGSFTFDRRDKISTTYMLRLSNHYLWHIRKVRAIRITNDKDLLSIEILKDKRPEHTAANTN